MTWRGETEDGLGWGGLVPSKAEREAERAEVERRARHEREIGESFTAGRECERNEHEELVQAVEEILNLGHMHTGELARLRLAYEQMMACRNRGRRHAG